MNFKTFSPHETLPENVIFPQQVHGIKIVEIKTGKEDLSETDGIFTEKKDFLLGIKTADCAPIIFFDEKKFGVLHAGWRGLVNGICEKMLKNFQNPKIWIGPLFPIFEIQKDFCFFKIQKKFGDRFFSEKGGKIFFHFLDAIFSVLSNAEFCGESTEKSKWASHRQGDKKRNFTIIGEF